MRLLVDRYLAPCFSAENKILRRVNEYISLKVSRDFVEGRAWKKAEEWGFNQQNGVDWLEQNLP